MLASRGVVIQRTGPGPMVCRAPAIRLARRVVTFSAPAEVSPAPAVPAQPIALTEKALDHLKKLKAGTKDGESLYLRVGVRSGGCSGMSYNMEFEKPENQKPDDYLLSYDNDQFKIMCDPKSMLFLFGMSMDYSDALIGGGFKFSNPNATDSCGCGKSFGV